MLEERLQSGTEIVETRLAVRRADKPILGTASVAHGQHFTVPAELRKGVPLRIPEVPLRLALQQMAKWRFADIAHPVFAVDEVVARKEVAVVFEHRNLAAGFTEDTQ